MKSQNDRLNDVHKQLFIMRKNSLFETSLFLIYWKQWRTQSIVCWNKFYKRQRAHHQPPYIFVVFRFESVVSVKTRRQLSAWWSSMDEDFKLVPVDLKILKKIALSFLTFERVLISVCVLFVLIILLVFDPGKINSRVKKKIFHKAIRQTIHLFVTCYQSWVFLTQIEKFIDQDWIEEAKTTSPSMTKISEKLNSTAIDHQAISLVYWLYFIPVQRCVIKPFRPMLDIKTNSQNEISTPILTKPRIWKSNLI